MAHIATKPIAIIVTIVLIYFCLSLNKRFVLPDLMRLCVSQASLLGLIRLFFSWYFMCLIKSNKTVNKISIKRRMYCTEDLFLYCFNFGEMLLTLFPLYSSTITIDFSLLIFIVGVPFLASNLPVIQTFFPFNSFSGR